MFEDATVLDDEQPQAAQAVAVRAANAVAVAPAANDSQTLLSIITRVAADPTVDIEKVERLWAMHRDMKGRDNEAAFNAAMNKAQSEMGRVSADASNQQTRSRYATYGKLDAAVRPIYTTHGFSISFDTGDGAPEGCLRVLAYVSHSAGHTRTYHADMPADGKGAKGGDVMTKTHASGSAMSYGMRYLLKLIFNIAVGEDDDDGNGAGESDRSGQQQTTLSEALLDSARSVSLKGTQALRDWWDGLTEKERAPLLSEFRALRNAATKADQYAADRKGVAK
ncbi:ERF family protein [Methylibium petroleiphilum]